MGKIKHYTNLKNLNKSQSANPQWIVLVGSPIRKIVLVIPARFAVVTTRIASPRRHLWHHKRRLCKCVCGWSYVLRLWHQPAQSQWCQVGEEAGQQAWSHVTNYSFSFTSPGAFIESENSCSNICIYLKYSLSLQWERSLATAIVCFGCPISDK